MPKTPRKRKPRPKPIQRTKGSSGDSFCERCGIEADRALHKSPNVFCVNPTCALKDKPQRGIYKPDPDSPAAPKLSSKLPK